MSQEQLYASFLLDRERGVEIAIQAESVAEATPIIGSIQPLPASVSFFEGIMQLRTDVVPVINLKKRLGLETTTYEEDARVAVISLASQRFGLLFDDIKDVLRVDKSLISPILSTLQSSDGIITDLIKLDNGARTIELLNLAHLFPDQGLAEDVESGQVVQDREILNRTYSRFVVFRVNDQEYGVPVEQAQEITFLAKIEDMFKSGSIEGTLQLRGQTIPVMQAGFLLNGHKPSDMTTEDFRILVINSDKLTFGMIVNEIREIMTVADDEIMPMPYRQEHCVSGIHEAREGRDIMLLDVMNLIAKPMKSIKSLARFNKKSEDREEEKAVISTSRHVITENCYLVFRITEERNFAIEIKDVQEIIERDRVLGIPAADGFDAEVINLRGQVVQVVNLRRFYDYPDQEDNSDSRLIICKDGSGVVALEVDAIVTIYKQENYYSTPILNPHLQSKKDTLDRLIEFVGDNGDKRHVLIVNIHNLMRNYLQYSNVVTFQDEDKEGQHNTELLPEEDSHN